MAVKLAHVIKFVSDMDKAVAFHRDVLGLPVKFVTPGWSELGDGETTQPGEDPSLHHAGRFYMRFL